MDFFNTFDSQNALPLRDILFINDERILASIKDVSGLIKTDLSESPL
jgi:hypothetical protein